MMAKLLHARTGAKYVPEEPQRSKLKPSPRRSRSRTGRAPRTPRTHSTSAPTASSPVSRAHVTSRIRHRRGHHGLHTAAHCCTSLHIAAHRCTPLHIAAPWLHLHRHHVPSSAQEASDHISTCEPPEDLWHAETETETSMPGRWTAPAQERRDHTAPLPLARLA